MKKISVYLLFTCFTSLAIANTQLSITTFSSLPGWQTADTIKSFDAFKQSCEKMLTLSSDEHIGTPVVPLTVSDWHTVCTAATKLSPINTSTTKAFFQTYFTPYAVSDSGKTTGLFTGYYLPAVHGRVHKTAKYCFPLYDRPSDLVTAKLGLFKTDLQGKKIAGRIVDGKLYPYGITREQINNGALDGKAKVLAWIQYQADQYLIQVQGSGIILLPHHKKMLLGYNGDNGEPFYPVGKWFLEHHVLSPQSISMHQITDWLKAHPEQAKTLIDQDKAFVFFAKLDYSNPLGTEAVPLTGGYSLAVDGNIIPLGAPLWISTVLPAGQYLQKTTPLQRLLIAQDTGGAIVGSVRADVYFGAGEQAADLASHMKNPGRYWILLPKKIS